MRRVTSAGFCHLTAAVIRQFFVGSLPILRRFFVPCPFLLRPLFYVSPAFVYRFSYVCLPFLLRLPTVSLTFGLRGAEKTYKNRLKNAGRAASQIPVKTKSSYRGYSFSGIFLPDQARISFGFREYPIFSRGGRLKQADHHLINRMENLIKYMPDFKQ